VAVGTVWRRASWLDDAQTPAPKDSKPTANSPNAAKAKRPGRRPESIEVKEVCPFKVSSSTLMENEFYAPVGNKLSKNTLLGEPIHITVGNGDVGVQPFGKLRTLQAHVVPVPGVSQQRPVEDDDVEPLANHIGEVPESEGMRVGVGDDDGGHQVDAVGYVAHGPEGEQLGQYDAPPLSPPKLGGMKGGVWAAVMRSPPSAPSYPPFIPPACGGERGGRSQGQEICRENDEEQGDGKAKGCSPKDPIGHELVLFRDQRQVDLCHWYGCMSWCGS